MAHAARLRIATGHGALSLKQTSSQRSSSPVTPPGRCCGSPRRPQFASGVQCAAAASFTAPFGSSSFLVSAEPAVETFLSRYALGSALGQGSFGTVHSAVDRVTGEHFAVKVVSKSRNAGRNQRSAVNREAQLWKRACAASRQAGRFYAVEEDAGSYYLVSEMCDGGSLQDLLDSRGALQESELSQVAWCMLTFMSDMHKHGVYYGDMKPGNVILKDVYPCHTDAACLNVRVVDFGCSQLVSPGSPLRAMSGSPLFLAPEILKGAYGLPADMWALGVTLYMLLCNRLPFWLEPIAQLEELDVDQVNAAISYSPVLFAGKQWKGVSEDLKDLICGLLEKDPARRLTAAAAMEHRWFAGAKEMCGLPQ